MQLHDAQFGGRISAQALAGEVGACVEMDNLQVFADIFTIGTGMPSIDVASAAPPICSATLQASAPTHLLALHLPQSL